MKDFVQVKTSELTGQALDWAVVCALNGKPMLEKAFPAVKWGESFTDAVLDGRIKPTTDWGQCGVLIDEYDIAINGGMITKEEYGTHERTYYITLRKVENGRPMICANGETRLIGVCRAIVATELGETVMVPSILVK